MRILHLIDSSGIYGAEVMVLNLMFAQKQMGLEPVLVSMGSVSEGKKDVEEAVVSRGIEVLPIRLKRGPRASAAQLMDACRTGRGDIIHSHGYKANILLGFQSRLKRGKPVLATLHGWTAMSLFSKMGAYQILDLMAIRRLDAAVAVTSAVLNKPRVKMCGIKAVVIHNGLGQLEFPAGSMEDILPGSAQAYDRKYNILSIGRLSPEKGLDCLLRAAALLRGSGIENTVTLVGEGPEKEKLIDLSKELGIAGQVLFLGYRRDAYQLLPLFDVFALPSHTEGLPVTMLEAMQSGTPIVATSVGEIPEMLDSGALGKLVRAGDVAELARALEIVRLDRTAAQERAMLCQEKAKERYGINAMAESYHSLYRSLIDRYVGRKHH